jgi:hypothetical protein
LQGAGKETGVQQVQNRMLHPTQILIDGQPVFDRRRINRHVYPPSL